MTPTEPPLVLVVEDDPPVRALLVELLSDGYAVLEAQDGLEAVQAADRVLRPARHPCLMLLDMMLPHLDGLGVLQHLRDQRLGVPVAAMSADRILLTRAATAGAEAILPKPFDVDQVLQVVKRFCAAPDA